MRLEDIMKKIKGKDTGVIRLNCEFTKNPRRFVERVCKRLQESGYDTAYRQDKNDLGIYDIIIVKNNYNKSNRGKNA